MSESGIYKKQYMKMYKALQSITNRDCTCGECNVEETGEVCPSCLAQDVIDDILLENNGMPLTEDKIVINQINKYRTQLIEDVFLCLIKTSPWAQEHEEYGKQAVRLVDALLNAEGYIVD